jgi:hypothetical protein
MNSYAIFYSEGLGNDTKRKTAHWVSSERRRGKIHSARKEFPLSYHTPISRQDGKVVGHVKGNEFIKKVHKSRHQLHKPRAWSCDIDVLQKVHATGAREIVLLEQEERVEWRAPLNLFWRKGFPINRGHGLQRGLSTRHWKQIGPHVPEQLELFTS